MNIKKILLLILLIGFVGKPASPRFQDIATIKGGLSILSGAAAGTSVGVATWSKLEKIRKELEAIERLNLESLMKYKENLHGKLSEQEIFEIEKNIFLYQKLSSFKKFIGAKDKDHRRMFLAVSTSLLTALLVTYLSYIVGEAVLRGAGDVAGRAGREAGERVIHDAIINLFEQIVQFIFGRRRHE